MDTNEFKKGYNPTTNVDKGDLIADSHSILARRRNHFSQLLNIHEVNDVRQTELHTAEPLVPKRLRWLLKSCKDTNHQALTKFQANRFKQNIGEYVLRYVNFKLLLFGTTRNCPSSERS
jgi:hypothetical protein